MIFSKTAIISLGQILISFLLWEYSVKAGVLSRAETDKNDSSFDGVTGRGKGNIHVYYIKPKHEVSPDFNTTRRILQAQIVKNLEENRSDASDKVNNADSSERNKNDTEFHGFDSAQKSKALSKNTGIYNSSPQNMDHFKFLKQPVSENKRNGATEMKPLLNGGKNRNISISHKRLKHKEQRKVRRKESFPRKKKKRFHYLFNNARFHRQSNITENTATEAETKVNPFIEDEKPNQKKTMEFGSINETKTLYYNDTSLYANISKTELKITVPVFQKESLSRYDRENKFVKPGFLKNNTYTPGFMHRYISYCQWILDGLKKHAIIIGIILTDILCGVVLIMLFLYCQKKREMKKTAEHTIGKKDPKHKLTKYKKLSDIKLKEQEDEDSKGSSGMLEQLSPHPGFQNQTKQSTQIVDNIMSQSKRLQAIKSEERRLLLTSDESEPEYGDRRRKLSKRKLKKKRRIPSIDEMKHKEQKQKKTQYTTRFESSSDESDLELEEKKEYKSKLREKRKEDSEVIDEDQRKKERIEPSTSDFNLNPETRRKKEEEEGEERKLGKKVVEAPADDSDEKEDEQPTSRVKSLNQWVHNLVKAVRPDRVDEYKPGRRIDSSEIPKTPSQRSSTETDKTNESRRQSLLTFLSRLRRKERTAKHKTKIERIIAPPVRTVVSESDILSDDILPITDPNELTSRIITTGDGEKIDSMLVSCEWDRSFYTADDIETIGERDEELQHHEPGEKRKFDAAKIAGSQTEMLGTLSKNSSADCLRSVVGKSIYQMESTSNSPRAFLTYN